MKEIKLDVAKNRFAISRYNELIDRVNPGEIVSFYTHDAFCNQLDDVEKKPADVHMPPDPLVGPVYIEGAEPGDTLKINIQSIERVRDWAVSTYPQGLGALAPNTIMISETIPEKTYIYRFDEVDGRYHYDDKLHFAWDPLIGTIGTAHAIASTMSITPFENGGNMDVPDVKPGNTLYLPVSVEGAYFYIGDCHGCQGQGEICGTGLEIAAKTTLKFELIKGKSIASPRIESKDELMCVGCAKPMEDAARIALNELIGWLEEFGWNKMDAYQAVSQSNKLYVGSMVNPNYVIVAKIAKEIALRTESRV